MKIIQTQNQVLTTFRSLKNIIISIGLIMVLIGSLVITSCSPTVPGDKLYENEEALMSVFEENIDEFTSIIEMVQTQELIHKYFEDYAKLSIGNIARCKKYLDKDNYNKLKEFWEKYQPNSLSNTSITFLIDCLKEDYQGPSSIDFIYFPGGTLDEVIDLQTYYMNGIREGTGQCQELHDGWFAFIDYEKP